MAKVKQTLTQDQLDVKNSVPLNDFIDDYEDDEKSTIQIPDFLVKKQEINPLDVDEISHAILNNVPGNTEVEEMNHLNELENYAKNLKEKEWEKILYHAPSVFMTKEIQRRLQGHEEFRKAMVDASDIMSKLKL